MREPRIRLGLEHAKTLLNHLDGLTVPGAALREAKAGLAREVVPAVYRIGRAKMSPPAFPKPSRADREKTKRREDAAQARKDRKVYAAVTARAGGSCEHCGRVFGSGLNDKDVRDHFWGRGKEDTTEDTVWVLCGACNRSKTDNVPDRGAWIWNFRAHCNRYGYKAQAARCVRELEAERDIARASEVSRGR